MFRSIWEDIRQQYSFGNMVVRLIIINLAVFVGLKLIYVVLTIGNGGDTPAIYSSLKHFFMISADDWVHNFLHPWSLVTHMFLHESFFHILFNMLFLYWFGRIVGDFLGNQRVLPLYLLGGLAGAVAYFLGTGVLGMWLNSSVNSSQVSHFALGASAAVMANIAAAAATSPDYEMRLLFLGNVKLKYIALGLILFDLVGIANNQNTGGHFGHLGGALMGLIFVMQLRKGNDLAAPINRWLDKIRYYFSRLSNQRKDYEERQRHQNRTRPKVVHRADRVAQSRPKGRRKAVQRDHQEQLDAILDKIKESGYDNLTDQEKEFLFNASKQK